MGPVIYADELVHVDHRATGALGSAFVETRRHVPHLDGLTDDEAAAVGRATARLAAGLRALLAVEVVHSFVAGLGVAHFHQHVVVRHRGTPADCAWWQQWPGAPEGDTAALCEQLRPYVAGDRRPTGG